MAQRKFLLTVKSKKIWFDDFKKFFESREALVNVSDEYSGHGCKSQAWQIEPGRAVPDRKFKWTGRFSWAGPFRPKISAGQAVFCQYFADIPPFFERTMLNLKWIDNKIQILFKKSFKNTDRNKIGYNRPGPAQDFSWAGPLRPKISAGPDRTGFTTLILTLADNQMV